MQSKYNGYTIAVTNELTFRVEFNPNAETRDERDTRDFKSAEEARAAIDDYIKAQSRMKLKARQVKLTAISEGGEEVTITGVHAGNGSITFKPKLKKRYKDDLYPAVGFVPEAIRELCLAEQRVESLKKALDLVEITLEDADSWKKRGVERNTEILLRNYDLYSKLAERLKTVEAAIKEAKKKSDDLSVL